ncbi:MAG: hypothetical protein NC078_12405 [Ruminococcus sp.]|nr:hypothetical protein [Ruminococcus sp.]
MPEFGYKISGMAGAERYFEAERLLDIKLKGFEKGNAAFEADGSRRQEYIKNEEDGEEKKVTLVKNVTESGTLVFSNFELKFFKFGGRIFYLWDILPTVIMGLFWWRVFPRLMSGVIGYVQMGIIQALAGAAWFGAGILIGKIFERIESREHKVLKILFVPYRTKLRTQFLLRGGAVTVIGLLYAFTRLFAGLQGYQIARLFFTYPIIALAVSVIPLFMKGRRER